jgi:outer membrane protein TolC
VAIHTQQLVPAVQARLDTTLAAYGAGNAGYTAVAEARRAVVDTHVHYIELRADVARAAIALRYFE